MNYLILLKCLDLDLFSPQNKRCFLSYSVFLQMLSVLSIAQRNFDL